MRLLIPFLLTVFAAPALAEIEVLPGTTPQTAVVGQVLPKPVRFRVTDQGVPVEQAVVSFSTSS
jgi:hypothetical protein